MPIYEEKEKVNGQKRWFIRTYVNDEYGKRKQITRHNKSWIGRDGHFEAQQEEIRLKNNINIFPQKKLSINELKEKFIEKNNKFNKESTCYDYASVIDSRIVPYFQNKNIYKLQKKDFEYWKKELDKCNLKKSYKNKCYTVFSNLLNFGVKELNLEKNWILEIDNFKISQEEKQKIKVTEKIKYITYEQFEQLISNVDDDFWFTFFNFLYFTGVRIGELQGLKWCDINFEEKYVSINKTLTTKVKGVTWKLTSTKNLKNRRIDIDKNLIKNLQTFYIQRKKLKGFDNNWFVFGDLEPLKEHRIDTNREKYFIKAKLSEITNHEFRHSHVSFLINQYLKSGETDTAKFFVMCSKRMGHTIEVMTKTYLHLFPDIQKPIVDLIENIDI